MLILILYKGPGGSMSQVYITIHTSLSPIRCEFAPSFVNYKKGCSRLAAASDKVYQLLAHGRWFSPGTPASSTTKTDRHDIAEILLKVALSTKNQKIKSNSDTTGRYYYFTLDILTLDLWPNSIQCNLSKPKHKSEILNKPNIK